MIASNRGLGFLVQSSANQYAIAGVFAALFVIMIVSMIMNVGINTLEHRYTHWKDSA